MSNMSYCRFQNTLGDLQDCYDNMDNPEKLSFEERKARWSLIKLCEEIAGDCGGDRIASTGERSAEKHGKRSESGERRRLAHDDDDQGGKAATREPPGKVASTPREGGEDSKERADHGRSSMRTWVPTSGISNGSPTATNPWRS